MRKDNKKSMENMRSLESMRSMERAEATENLEYVWHMGDAEDKGGLRIMSGSEKTENVKDMEYAEDVGRKLGDTLRIGLFEELSGFVQQGKTRTAFISMSPWLTFT